jgi:hypothetical protein
MKNVLHNGTKVKSLGADCQHNDSGSGLSTPESYNIMLWILYTDINLSYTQYKPSE